MQPRWTTTLNPPNRKGIQYCALDAVDQSALLALVNSADVRAHLIEHPIFDQTLLADWIASKMEIHEHPQYFVYAVMVDNELAGWCGIQPDEDGAELAIVISKAHWGLGLKVFRNMMAWSRNAGHKEVLFHLLETRRSYRALEKMAKEVRSSDRLGRQFTTYILSTEAEK